MFWLWTLSQAIWGWFSRTRCIWTLAHLPTKKWSLSLRQEPCEISDFWWLGCRGQKHVTAPPGPARRPVLEFTQAQTSWDAKQECYKIFRSSTSILAGQDGRGFLWCKLRLPRPGKVSWLVGYVVMATVRDRLGGRWNRQGPASTQRLVTLQAGGHRAQSRDAPSLWSWVWPVWEECPVQMSPGEKGVFPSYFLLGSFLQPTSYCFWSHALKKEFIGHRGATYREVNPVERNSPYRF